MRRFSPHPLLPRLAFMIRFALRLGIGLGIVAGSLSLGAFGYHRTEGLPWIDAFLNASMILTGMGPVDTMRTNAGKLFATGYALFSGVFFLTMAAVLFAPLLHRFLHRFHLELYSDEKDEGK